MNCSEQYYEHTDHLQPAMSIFSPFAEHRLRTSWRYTCPGILWRMLFSPGGFLVGEIRNPEMQRTTFFCLDERSGKVSWEGKSLAEPWWVGIEAVLDQVILFHTYVKPDMPQHRGISGWDLRHGEQLWERPRDIFQLAHDGLVYTAQEGFEQRRFFAVDAFSGEVRSDLGADSTRINELRAAIDEDEAYKQFSYPEQIAEPAQALARLGLEGIPGFEAAAIEGSIDLLEFPPCAILSWHERGKKGEEGLSQKLAILEKESGRQLFADTLQEKIPFPGQDSFFMKGEMLYFVKDLAILTAIDLGRA